MRHNGGGKSREVPKPVRTLYLMSVWLHIVAAALWVGGMLFLVLVLLPAVRRGEGPERTAALVQKVGRRYRDVGWGALGVLAVTGTVNVALRGVGWADLWEGAFWSGAFGRVLAVKLVLVGITLALSLIHDLVVGPRATAAWQGLRQGEGGAEGAGGARARALRLRRLAAWMGRLNLLVALAIVALGVMLVRGAP